MIERLFACDKCGREVRLPASEDTTERLRANCWTWRPDRAESLADAERRGICAGTLVSEEVKSE